MNTMGNKDTFTTKNSLPTSSPNITNFEINHYHFIEQHPTCSNRLKFQRQVFLPTVTYSGPQQTHPYHSATHSIQWHWCSIQQGGREGWMSSTPRRSLPPNEVRICYGSHWTVTFCALIGPRRAAMMTARGSPNSIWRYVTDLCLDSVVRRYTDWG